jgi:aminoglycoside 6'-N-acetyltransferase I
MTEVTVRPAGADDVSAVRSLFETFYREEGLAGAVGTVAETLPHVINRADTACFVAEAAGAVIGAAAMSTSYGLEVGLYAELEDLYVLPAWRAHGVASALVVAILEEARARGCSDVEVVLTPHAQTNPDLQAWYARRGFENTGRIILERPLDDGEST